MAEVEKGFNVNNICRILRTMVGTHAMINETISMTAPMLLAAGLHKSAGQGTVLPPTQGNFARGGGGFGAMPK